MYTLNISFENRKLRGIPGQTVFVTLDGTDFAVNEVTPFDVNYYSHKINDAGVRYDVALNIATGDIVYWGGGYPAGKYNDLQQAQMGILPLLPAGEKNTS